MLEDDFAEMLESGDYTMDADDLKSMDCEVTLLTSEMFDTLMLQWREGGGAPLFPREEVE